MPPATRKQCDYPTCDRGPIDDNTGNQMPYITPVGIQTREEVNEELRQHVETAHLLPIRLNESARIDAEARRQEALARTVEAEAARNLSTRDPTPPVHQQQQIPTAARLPTEKIATLPKPSIQLESTESDW